MKIKAWILSARPKTLPVAICSVSIGIGLAYTHGFLHMGYACLTLMVAVLIQIGTNYANDYFDYQKGADTPDRVGPTRATQAGWVTPEQMKVAFCLVFFLAFLGGIALVFRGGWPILLIGILAILSGIWYTAGKYALGYLGLGDLFVLVFFGPVSVAGTYYIQTLHWSAQAWILGLSTGLFAMAILVVNNIRDVDHDALVEKKTLAVRLGVKWAKFEYNMAINMACFVPFFLFGTFKYLLLLMVLIPALKIKMTVWHQTGAVLNQALAQTGLLLILFTGLLLGLLVFF